jgi:hypothetical protein
MFAAAGTAASDKAWYEYLLDWFARVGEILAALVAAGAVLGFAWAVYRRTLGRRRDRYGRLARLGTNAQVSFFSSVLGEPPAMRRTVEGAMTRYDDTGNHYLEPRTWIECVWIDRDYYVQALADEDETIHAYSVTTRSKRFRPTFRQPGHWWIERGRLGRLLHLPQSKPNPEIKLGRTRFRKLGRPEQASSWIGARNVHYFEAYWGANPGLHQWFIYSINDAGYGGFDAGWDLEHMEAFSWGFPDDVMPDSQLARVQPAHGAEDAQAQGLGSSSNDSVADAEPAHEPSFEKHSEEPLPAFYDAFRRNAKINTYTVLGPSSRSTTTPSSRGCRRTRRRSSAPIPIARGRSLASRTDQAEQDRQFRFARNRRVRNGAAWCCSGV